MRVRRLNLRLGKCSPENKVSYHYSSRATDAVLMRQTRVHDYQKLNVCVSITFIDLITHGK